MPGQAGRGEGWACREQAATASSIPGAPATYRSERETEPGAAEMQHVATAKSATELNLIPQRVREKGEGEKALTGLSMSAGRARLGPGVRQPRRRRGLPGVDDHALITMSQVGQTAKTSSKCTELPC